MLNKKNKEFKFQEFWIRTKREKKKRAQLLDLSTSTAQPSNHPPSFSAPSFFALSLHQEDKNRFSRKD